MKKDRSSSLILLGWCLLCVLAGGLTFGALRYRRSLQIVLLEAGQFTDSPPGERAALKLLSQHIRNGATDGKVKARWFVIGQLPNNKKALSIFAVEFKPSTQQLFKYEHHNRHSSVFELDATEYTNVSERAIHEIVIGGQLSEDLTKYGAVFRKKGLMKLDKTGAPILPW